MCITRQHPLTNHATFSHQLPPTNPTRSAQKNVKFPLLPLLPPSAPTSSSCIAIESLWPKHVRHSCPSYYWQPPSPGHDGVIGNVWTGGEGGGERGWPADGKKQVGYILKQPPSFSSPFISWSKGETNGFCPKEMGENPSRIPKSRKMFQHVGSRCPSIWGGSLFYLLAEFLYAPWKTMRISWPQWLQ